MPEIQCPQCGKKFKRSPSRITSQNPCCSYKCKDEFRFDSENRSFWDNVLKTDKCWIWKAAVSKAGYGTLHGGRKKEYAHRKAWILTNGEIPKGLFVCHDCPDGDNPLCVNPSHMFLGTQKDNMMDAARKSKTPFGERNGGCKLTEAKVIEIRSRCEAGESQYKLAAEFGVCRSTIGLVKSRKNWSWLP